MPHFQEFYDAVKNDPTIAIFTINTDENKGLVQPFMTKNGYSFPVLFGEGLGGKFGIRGIPATFIIDSSGIVRIRMVGFNQKEPLVPYLTKLAAQYRAKPVAAGK